MMFILSISLAAEERKPVFPAGVKPIGPYSPGLIAAGYLYVSGQGAKDAAGKLPATVEGQTKQCLENIKAVVEQAGLTMEHVVYTHIYLSDIKSYDAMNRAYAPFFPGMAPARSTVGVTRMPLDTPVEISAIALIDKDKKTAVKLPGGKSPVPISAGILTPDRYFISGILGRNAETGVTPPTPRAQLDIALTRLTVALATARIHPSQLSFLNVYRTAAMPRAALETAVRAAAPDAAISVVDVASLPFGVSVGITGVASVDAAEKRVSRRAGVPVCASAGSAIYCAAQSGAGPDEAFRIVEAGLKELGSSVAGAVANTVFLDDIDHFAGMNKDYGAWFPAPQPTRTTVQPLAASKTGVRISVVAVRQ